MNIYECFVCGQPQESKTCDRCRNGIRGLLARLPLQWFALLDSRQRVQGGGGDGRSSTRLHAPLPGREDVLNLLGPASRQAVTDAHDQTGPAPFLETLKSWADAVTDERGLTPVRRDFKEILVRLTAHVTWICEQPWVTDFEAEIRELVRTTQRITMTEPRKELLRGVTCPSCEGLTLVRYSPGDWAAECVLCPAMKLDERDYEALVRGQAQRARDGVKS
ncbi:hypothetical protein PO587_02725 [Streptomyces gilvifuscus]|uniref:Uncharacterized protein n=1 Tax=Streptomyces gilvifuscus TaxID=1550617 RepID=A0ABT5FLH2_9ACTN|nr:hypothetical protein [Streptomyces gilvifuscus]MDC2953365.1 hypothetical protein [Streptomyces gilvifuscus]